MTPEEWRRVSAIFAAALTRDPAARGPFLDEACAGEPALRREVEALIAAAGAAAVTLDLADALPAGTSAPPSLIGQRFGSYTILSQLGRGGMGEVYRAYDRTLDREVAIKTIPADLRQSPERHARFHREARMLAALNHPNVAAIYGFEEFGTQTFLVMELVDGETLAERLQQGALPVTDAIDAARQIVDALEAAHAKRVVHRDLKPANIKLTPQGRIKVLDFGLAKSQPPVRVDTRAMSSGVRTEPGLAFGTPPYMSPEQVRGEEVDYRTDLWAFGCVLYELLTARQPFGGETVADSVAAVLQREPDWRALPRTVPDALRLVIRRCLAKEPGRRWQSAADLGQELRRAAADPAGPGDERSWIEGVLVLPLRNLSGQPAQEFFAEGMTEALIWDLAKLRALRVISRTSAMRYKDTDKSLPEIARELNVDAVLEGSVSCENGRVLVRAHLVHAPTDRTIWGASYDRDLKDVLILQSELALAIAREIRVVVTADEQRQFTDAARVVDPDAYESYLKGQFHWGKLTPPDLDAALGYFERAREKEPVLADVGIAAVWLARQQMNLAAPAVAGPRAKAAALRALADGDSQPEAHYINALVSWAVDWDWVTSGREFQRALELRANYAEARAYHSHFLTILGRPLDAIAEMQRAIDSDPHNALFKCLFGIVLVFARQYDRAIQELQAVQRVVPINAVINRGLMCAFHLKGLAEDTLAQTRAWFTATNDREALAALDRGAGTAALGEVAEVLAARGRAGYYATSDISTMYICAGRPDKALEWFEAGLDLRDPDMPYIRSPICDVIRHEPRYQRVVEKMNFPR